jgi:CheY-like chemotaxis protein
MDAATRRRLFEPFFTTKAEGQGTGLGLVSVRSIVEQNDGAIEVESEPGAGTTLRIDLPRAAGSAGPEAAAGSGAARTARILLVDDDDTVRATILRALLRTGHRVETAHSGEEALAIAASRDFDLLVTDIGMPGLDGPTLARRLRERAPGLRVLFTSGYASDDRVGRLEAGRTEFLPKPFSPSELARKVGEMVAAR